MRNTFLTTTGVVESTSSTDTLSQSVSYSTSHLSSLFASFLTGDYVNTMRLAKHFELYDGSPEEIKSSFEDGSLVYKPSLAKVDVRSSSTSSVASSNNKVEYVATFIATIQGRDHILPDINNTSGSLTLGLFAGNMLLAVTTFDRVIYQNLVDHARVEIKWKLQLKDSVS